MQEMTARSSCNLPKPANKSLAKHGFCKRLNYKIMKSLYTNKTFDVWLKNVLFSIFCALFFGAVTWKLIFFPDGPITEYGNHIGFAIRMYEEGRVVVPHFLFQLLTIIHYGILSLLHVSNHKISVTGVQMDFSWGLAGFLVVIEAYVGIALVLRYWLRMIFIKQNSKSFDNTAYCLAFCLSIMAPIFILALYDNYYYLGYITPSTIYIIPTQILLKLPSLGLFLLTPKLFQVETTKKSMFCIGLLTILSLLAKPSWGLVMLPALGIIAVIYILIGRYINWRALLVVFLMALVVLGWQYYFKFIDSTSPIYSSQIIITAPFEVWRHYSEFVFIKIILSVGFPLYVTLFFWRNALSDFYVKYAWLLFLIGLVYTGFFGESGRSLYAGNFIWCGQIACFMLFVATTANFFGKCFIHKEDRTLKVWGGFLLFFLHVISGLVYYFRSFTFSFV